MLPGDPGSAPATPKSIDDQHKALTDAEGKISPLTFPEPSVSPEYVNSMASGLRTVGASISDTGNSITGAWSGLRECYTAPESETLHAVLDPVATDGEEVSGSLASAATALEAFAENVQSIKGRWSTLRGQAYELLARIEAEGEDWDKVTGWDRVRGNDSPLSTENAALVSTGETIIEDYAEYETVCADAINKDVPDRTSFAKMPEGGGDLDPNVFYHGFEQDLSELATEWGSAPAGTDHGWWIDAGAAVRDFGVGAVEGTGAMLGFHSSEGWFNQSWGDSLKEYHMDNLQSAASLVGLYDNETGEFGIASKDSVKGAWKDLAHSVVPWEEWGDRPGYVIGTALLNIGATVGGAVLTATGVGAVVGVPLMAWRGAAILDGMGGSGRGGGSGVDLPDMPTNTPINAQVGPGQMEVIKAYMDQLVNPVYPDSGGLGGGSSDSGAEGSGAARAGVSNSQQQGDNSAVHASHRRSGEQPEVTAEELRVFNEMMENDPQLKGDLEQHRPAFEELDSTLGDGTWTGGGGAGRPLVDGSPGETHRSTEGSNQQHDQQVDLSGTNEPGSRPHSDGDSNQGTATEHSRTAVAVLERDNNGSGGDGSNGRDSQDDSAQGANGERSRTDPAEATFASGPSSGGPGESGLGTGSGQGPNDARDQNGSQGEGPNTGDSRNGGHQGNPWDKEWNNEKLDDRYRPPEITAPDRQRTIEKGVRPKDGDPKYPGVNQPFAEKGGLKPDSVYDVKGRGRFYTDSDGKVSYIDTHPGQKGARNPDLRVPKDEARYAVDVLEHPGRKYFFETDGKSRTTHAHGELRRIRVDEDGNSISRNDGNSSSGAEGAPEGKKSKSDPYRSGDQSKEGNEGNSDYPKGSDVYHSAEWDGGHFFGTGFGGSGHRLNIYPQLRELNQPVTGTKKETNFFKLEEEWRDLLKDGKNVQVWFDAEYDGSKQTPHEVTVRYSIDGVDQTPIKYVNTPDLKSESARPRSYTERFGSGGAAATFVAAVAVSGMETTGNEPVEEIPGASPGRAST